MRILPGTLWLAVVFAAACDDGGSAPPVDTEPAVVELGTGEHPTRFEPLEDEQQVWITAGLQGGHHIWGSFKAEHVEPLNLNMRFALYDGDRQIGAADYIDEVRRGPTGSYEYGGVTVFLWDDTPPASIDGRAIRMTLEIEDARGRVASDARTVIARCCE
ncbi:MAG: hypothetical protein H6704_16645 [Myxococcales bacterium]|nr:hypothetical protein [Myxococcales bacterium]MCB9537883.1 hypothetical protein [Myxococcales bacterium]